MHHGGSGELTCSHTRNPIRMERRTTLTNLERALEGQHTTCTLTVEMSRDSLESPPCSILLSSSDQLHGLGARNGLSDWTHRAQRIPITKKRTTIVTITTERMMKGSIVIHPLRTVVERTATSAIATSVPNEHQPWAEIITTEDRDNSLNSIASGFRQSPSGR